ncbi:MAG: OB-fold nucleic acid binding domain-containing protein, partial [Desulfobacterales bacterium]|nr:OB-fold nucleic acid binding domain-containing protein [Desulfobacterales bacterium]
MKRTLIAQALDSKNDNSRILSKGWVRTKRDATGFSFLEVNDGACLKNIQIIVDASNPAYEILGEVNTGAAVEVTGALVPSPGKGQKWEVRANDIRVIGHADAESYPL